MNIDQLGIFLKQETLEEKRIIELLKECKEEILTSNIIEDILFKIFSWKIDKGILVITGESLMPLNENIMISKHHRFIPIPKHKHDFIELSYVYSGTFVQTIGKKTITLKEGEMCLLDMNIEHSIKAAGKDDIIINCLMRKDYFDTSLITRLSSNDLICDFLVRAIYESKDYNNYCIFKSGGNSKLKDLMRDLMIEYYDRSICFNEIMDCYIVLIFSELLKVYQSQEEETIVLDKKDSTSNIVEILKYIEDNYMEATLNSVAAKYHFHPNYLGTLIKKSTDKSFREIIHNKKLKHACSLLQNTDLSIEKILNEIGYNNQSFFYKKFKENFGITPQEYRNRASTI